MPFDETRRRLLTAAAARVRASGYRGASVDGILGPAGLTKGAFYHHFPSKEALGRLLVDQFAAELARTLGTAPMTAEAALSAALSEAGTAIVDLCGEYGEGMEGMREPLARALSAWQGRLEEASGSPSRAELLLAVSLGASLLAKVLGDPSVAARLAAQVDAPSSARAEGLSYID
ncbi:MAG: TetR/AcrR family transcriptional regulator [Planctomycetota bacterium]